MSHQLPDDPRAVVVSWRTSGGLHDRTSGEADLVVRADGSATAGARFGGGRPLDGRLKPEQLDELLRFTLDEQRFFAIDGPELDHRIAAAVAARGEVEQPGGTVALPEGPPYIDAGTTTIMIAADGRGHVVSMQGLFAAARDFPAIEELSRLRAIELKLLDLVQLIAAQAGG